MTQSTAVAERDIDQADEAPRRTSLAVQVKGFEQELDLRTATFAQALPEHVPVAKFKRNLLMAVVQNPDLLNCWRPSLFQSAMTSASLGLLLDPALGHGYILPFRDNKKQRLLAQFIPGYRGYLHLARQSGEISSVSAYEVCAKDHFVYELGLNEKLEHKPAMGDRGELVYVYCIVRHKDGGHHVEVMTKGDVDRIRARSQSKNSPAWRDDYMMMARKTVIRRASKYMPLSVQRAAALDAAYDTGRIAHIENGEIVIEGEEADDAPQIEHGGSKLEQFEGRHGGATDEPAHDPDTGEIAQDAPAPEPMPPSPLTAKKGAVDTAWLAWERAASQRIETMPQAEIAGFLSEHGAVFDEMAKLRPASWQAIEALIERKKDAA